MKKLVTIDNLKVFLRELRKEVERKIEEASRQNEVRVDKSYREIQELNLRPKNDVDSVLHELIYALREHVPELERSVLELYYRGFKKGSSSVSFTGEPGFFVEYDGKDYELGLDVQGLYVGTCTIQLDAPLRKETKIVLYKNFNKRVVGKKVLMSAGKPVVLRLQADGGRFNANALGGRNWPPEGKTLAGIQMILNEYESTSSVLVFETVKRYNEQPDLGGNGEFSRENFLEFIKAVGGEFVSSGHSNYEVDWNRLGGRVESQSEQDDYFLWEGTVFLIRNEIRDETQSPDSIYIS